MTLPMQTSEHDFARRAKLRVRGNRFEDFTPGRTFAHHWGRTITQAENALFTTLTLHYNPHYFNLEYAQAHHHPDTPLNPMLVFNTVFGLSVEDLSEGGGPFLGIEDLTFHMTVYPGDTLTARSTVVEGRTSSKHTNMGIVTWHTEGFNKQGDRVIDFRRTNLVRMRESAQ
jgi:itaconyl-CoA hydratase